MATNPMTWKPAPRWSLKTRLTIFTVAIFVISVWSLAFYVTAMLRTDMERTSGEQQLSTVSLVGAQIDQALKARMDALELFAGSVAPSLLDNPAVLQKDVEERTILQNLFNAGIFVTRLDGNAIAEFPIIGRVGLNYLDRDHVAAALKEGRATVGRPVIGKRVVSPSFAITVPIRDPRGRVIGALTGATDMAKPNFLDSVAESRYGASGGFLIIDPAHRLFITASNNKTLVMQPLPAPGINRVLDRRLQGFDGPAVNATSRGVEVLTSSARVPVGGWFVVATLPTAEAFAPSDDMQKRVFLATAVLSVLMTFLTWWMIRRQLAPMSAASQALGAQTDASRHPRPLPVSSEDEIGELIGGFNRLLATLEKRDEALLLSEEQMAASQRFGGTGSWTYDPRTSAIQLSENMRAIFGLPPGARECKLEDLLACVPERDRVRRVLATAIGEGRPYDDEFAVNPVGQSRPRIVLSLGKPEAGVPGSMAKVLGFVQDVTEVRAIEADLRRHREQLEELVGKRTEALAASEQRWKFALEGAAQGVWDWDRVRGTAYYSPQYKRMLGYADDEPFETMAEAGFARLHPDDRAATDAAVERHLSGEAPYYTAEFRCRRKDGSWIWIESRGMVVERTPEGRATRMIGTHVDITTRKGEVLAMEKAKDQALAASRAKTAFLAMMSHELRTPLNGMMGMTELALRRATDPKQADYLAKAKVASKHLLAIINDVLDISNVESGHLVLGRVDFTLGATLEKLAGGLDALAAGKGLRLSVEVDPGLQQRHLAGDPTRLGQVLSNLAGNAIKFTDAGTVTLRVRAVEDSASEVRVRFEVQDTGIGISAEGQRLLFQPFEQVDASLARRYGGTGLGLAIAQRLVNLMGGEIDVASSPGVGSTFSFTLRFNAGAPASRLRSTPDVEPAEVALRRLHAGALILLADDNADNRELATELLISAGLQVDVAVDGEQAIALTREKDYAAVLMDVRLPRLDGLEATRRIRSAPSRNRLPILAMTAHAYPEDRSKCLKAGMNDYLAKPIESGKLYEALLRCLVRPG